MLLWLWITLFLFTASPLIAKTPSGEGQSCTVWPKIFAQEKLQKQKAPKERFLISPFRNDTDQPADNWLSEGIADLMQRYLSTHPSLGVLSESDLSRVEAPSPVRFKIEGLFQHIQERLRIFVQLKDEKGKLLAQFLVETPYPLHRRFFTGLKEAALGILEKTGYKKGVDLAALTTIETETDRLAAYENFIKGKIALESYDPQKIEVALIWFQEARREDSQYLAPYRGFMETYGFLSLVKKLNGEPYHEPLEAIENTLREMKKRIPSKKKKEEGETLDNRFLGGEVHYVSGREALSRGNVVKAVAELEEAARLVPEDALTLYHLGLAYDKMGKNGEGARYKARAKEIQPCLKEESL